MASPLDKLRFHSALYAAFLGIVRGRFDEVSKAPVTARDVAAQDLEVFFWTPATTAGANVIVHDVLPSLLKLAAEVAPGWKIHAGQTLPDHPVDWLISFKAVPPPNQIVGKPRNVLLICDQAEVYWKDLRRFDAVIATSSRPFAGLLAGKHPNVAFISESEPMDYLAFGTQNLNKQPAQRDSVLLWHGGAYSQDALNELRPALAKWAEKSNATLHVVSGKSAPRVEHWGALPVHFFPWSKAQLESSAAVARLGFVPARFSLKNSWLKPASRVRCLFALGVPAIGDDRVPDVVDFMTTFDGPLAGRSKPWLDVLTQVWADGDGLNRLANAGHAAVADGFSTEQTARQWIRYLNRPS